MTGEITAKNRPINSLLEQHFEFDTAGKIDPDIQREVENLEGDTNDNKTITELIEDTIKIRIIEEAYDDVIIILPTIEKIKNDKIELNFEKSTEGLGEIYEQEYKEKYLGEESQKSIDMVKLKRNTISLYDNIVASLEILKNGKFTCNKGIIINQGDQIDQLDDLIIKNEKISNN